MKSLLIALLLLASMTLPAQNSRFAEVNGTRVHYVVYGEGSPVLLLHNFTASHKMWMPWVKDLPTGFQYVIPDLRGHGLSDNPSSVFRHGDAALDLLALMDHLGHDRYRAVGASSGGMTLLHMATRDTSSLEAMVLIGATTEFPDEARNAARHSTYEKIDEAWRQSLLYHHPGGEESAREVLRLFREVVSTYTDMNFTPPYLSTIQCPTLIVHGDRDSLFPVGIPVDAYRSIPDAYLWIVPNGGHLPFVHEKEESIWTDVFLDVVTRFFGERPIN